MAYKIGKWSEAKNDFRECFGISIGPFYDGLMTLLCQSIKIDIVKFDEWIHKQHGDYELENKSLADIIFEYYGDEAAALIDELI
jgi:hypothetical protein